MCLVYRYVIVTGLRVLDYSLGLNSYYAGQRMCLRCQCDLYDLSAVCLVYRYVIVTGSRERKEKLWWI